MNFRLSSVSRDVSRIGRPARVRSGTNTPPDSINCSVRSYIFSTWASFK